ncbi:MAG: hypothetical protein P8X73_12705 [Ignavibacteriaceae bacterium]
MHKIFLSSILIFIVFILISSCSEDNPTEPGNPNASVPNPTLSSIQSNVFTTTCALVGCHGNSGTQANLNLTNGQSFANLVGVTSQLFPPSKRVEAGDGAISILIRILRGQVSPRMPQDRAALSDAIIDSIEKWIDNGALNN